MRCVAHDLDDSVVGWCALAVGGSKDAEKRASAVGPVQEFRIRVVLAGLGCRTRQPNLHRALGFEPTATYRLMG
jgi:hypothetical protein